MFVKIIILVTCVHYFTLVTVSTSYIDYFEARLDCSPSNDGSTENKNIRSGSIRRCSELFGNVRSFSELFGNVRSCSELFEAVRSFSELFEAVRSCSEMFEVFRSCSELFGNVRSCSELFEAVHRNNTANLSIHVIPEGVTSQSDASAGIDIKPRIIGGQTASTDQFPYQVSIRINGAHVCGGTIFSKRFVITAGHCVDKRGSGRKVGLPGRKSTVALAVLSLV
uniref:Peptidase S1 domain-containing protein n=1 Tax=Timema poppense TaxID=170557 RepID=A0A7R9HF68_TIMPO|nr:unnamed protein product [Timema poppensis]